MRHVSSPIYMFYMATTELGHEGRGIGMREARAGARTLSKGRACPGWPDPKRARVGPAFR